MLGLFALFVQLKMTFSMQSIQTNLLSPPTQKPLTTPFSFTMKLTALISLSAIAMATSTLAKSLTIPQDLTDGAYIISMDADGNQIATNITTTGTTGTDSGVDKRAVTWPSGTYAWCPGGSTFVDTDFYDHAWGLFYDSCKALGNSKIPNGGRLVVKWGSVVAYMCSYGNNPCRTAEWGEAVGWIAGVCTNAPRLYREAAYLHIPGWQKRYGYAQADAAIC